MRNEIVKTSYTEDELYEIQYHSVHNKGKHVCRIRGNMCQTEEDFFKELSAGMHFWYGFKWTWEDVILQLNHPRMADNSGYLLIVYDPELLFRKEKDRDHTMLQMEKCFQDAAVYWDQFEVPFTVFMNDSIKTGRGKKGQLW